MSAVINKIIKVLVVSDFFLNLGWGLMGPIFAIFVIENITVGSASEAARVAGFAAFFFWIVKSLLQVPIGHWLDKNHGERDDFWLMILGTFMMGFVPLGYLVSTHAWHIYAWQLFYALAAAIVVPPYSAIFTRHIDKGREAVEWSVWSTSVGVGAGIAGGVGGIAVGTFGFPIVFIGVAAFTFFSAALLFLIKDDISYKNKEVVRVPQERNVVEPPISPI